VQGGMELDNVMLLCASVRVVEKQLVVDCFSTPNVAVFPRFSLVRSQNEI